MADNCIVVKKLVKLSKLKNHNLLIIIRLYFPVLLHHWGHSVEFVDRHMKCVRIIQDTIPWRISILVLDELGLDKPREMGVVFVNLSVNQLSLRKSLFRICLRLYRKLR